MINPATSLTIAVKFLTSLSRRRLSRSKASAFSVLAWTEIIRNVNSHLGELVQIWLKIPGICWTHIFWQCWHFCCSFFFKSRLYGWWLWSRWLKAVNLAAVLLDQSGKSPGHLLHALVRRLLQLPRLALRQLLRLLDLWTKTRNLGLSSHQDREREIISI